MWMSRPRTLYSKTCTSSRWTLRASVPLSVKLGITTAPTPGTVECWLRHTKHPVMTTDANSVCACTALSSLQVCLCGLTDAVTNISAAYLVNSAVAKPSSRLRPVNQMLPGTAPGTLASSFLSLTPFLAATGLQSSIVCDMAALLPLLHVCLPAALTALGRPSPLVPPHPRHRHINTHVVVFLMHHVSQKSSSPSPTRPQPGTFSTVRHQEAPFCLRFPSPMDHCDLKTSAFVLGLSH